MGMRARVFVIGPLSILRKHDVLCYADDQYEFAPEDAVVLGSVAVAYTNEQSRVLALICDTRPWELWGHRAAIAYGPTTLFNEYIGDQLVDAVYEKIKDLLGEEGVQVWYEPNG